MRAWTRSHAGAVTCSRQLTQTCDSRPAAIRKCSGGSAQPLLLGGQQADQADAGPLQLGRCLPRQRLQPVHDLLARAHLPQRFQEQPAPAQIVNGLMTGHWHREQIRGRVPRDLLQFSRPQRVAQQFRMPDQPGRRGVLVQLVTLPGGADGAAMYVEGEDATAGDEADRHRNAFRKGGIAGRRYAVSGHRRHRNGAQHSQDIGIIGIELVEKTYRGDPARATFGGQPDQLLQCAPRDGPPVDDQDSYRPACNGQTGREYPRVASRPSGDRSYPADLKPLGGKVVGNDLSQHRRIAIGRDIPDRDGDFRPQMPVAPRADLGESTADVGQDSLGDQVPSFLLAHGLGSDKGAVVPAWRVVYMTETQHIRVGGEPGKQVLLLIADRLRGGRQLWPEHQGVNVGDVLVS